MSDQSPPAGTQTFNSAFPFNVALQNQFQENDLAIIYITDTVDAAKPEQQINVSITQNDKQNFKLAGISKPPSMLTIGDVEFADKAHDYRFNSTPNVVAINIPPNITLGDVVSPGSPPPAFTLEAWIQTSAKATPDFQAIFVKEWSIGLFVYNGVLRSYNWTNNEQKGTFAINDGQWHHLALAFESKLTNGAQLYVDGVAQGPSFTYTLSGNATSANKLGIGNNGRANKPIQFFNGNIGAVKLWKRRLSSSEIYQEFTHRQLADQSGLFADIQLPSPVPDGIQATIVPAKAAIVPNQEQYNFALVFRPGTLSNKTISAFSTLLQTALAGAVSNNPVTVNGPVIRYSDGAYIWYCLFNQDIPNFTGLSFTLNGLSAAAGVGSRSTKIEFLFDNLMLGGVANPFSFSRTAHVDIINHQGHSYAPMFFGVSGANTLWQDQNNNLKIYLETIGRVPLAFGSNTEIVFSFPYADAASELVHFGNLTEVNAYSLVTSEIVKFTTDKGVDDGNGRVQFTVKFSSTSLVIYVFDFSTIQISGDDGVVMLGVSIRNLPGYWDTDFQVPVIKAKTELELGCASSKGQLGKGSRIDFLSSLPETTGQATVPPVSIEESKGLNLYGDTNHPVKVKNADLQILEGGLSVSGATTLSSSLNVSGATALSSSLNVSGATTLNATTIDADLQVLGGRIRDKTGPVMPVGSIIAYAGEIFKIGAFDVEAYANANVDDLKGIHQTDQAAEAKYAADMQAWNFFSGKQCPSPPPAPFDLFNHWIVHGINEGRLGFIIDKDGKPYSGFAYGCSQAVDASCIACANPPEGWLLCDGSPIPAAFSELIAVVGGANTPNLCGRTLVGTGRLEDDRHFKKHFNLNDANGEFQHTLTEAEMPKHAHQTDSSIGWQINRVGGDELNLMCQIVGAKTFDTGGGQPHNNMQPYFAVNYIIKC